MTARARWRGQLVSPALRGAVAFAALAEKPRCPECQQPVEPAAWSLHRNQLCGGRPVYAGLVATTLTDLPDLPRHLIAALARAADEHGLPNVFFPSELFVTGGCAIRPMDQPRVIADSWFTVGCDRIGLRVTYEGCRYHVDVKPRA